ncbi:hypothetical protein C0992_004756, partial [Termitomyces sp. T32_za158]
MDFDDKEYTNLFEELTPEELQQIDELDEALRKNLVLSLPIMPDVPVPMTQSSTATNSTISTDLGTSLLAPAGDPFIGLTTDIVAQKATSDESSILKKRGRPLGSRNKNSKPTVKKIKNPIGRPPGTGQIQLEHTRGELEIKKKPDLELVTDSQHDQGNYLETPASLSSRQQETGVSSNLNENTLHILDDDDSGIDNDDKLLMEGIGKDDRDDDEVNASTSKVQLRPLPDWLKTLFDIHVNASGGHRGSDGLPPLYRDHHTFWFPKPSPFFVLRDIDTLTPQKLYNVRFFLWDPECLAPQGICCPNTGCTTQLHHHGHINRPRRVVDLSSTYYIIGYRYRCPKCKTTFRSWDPRIISSLPPQLAAEFPAKLTYRSGISLDVLWFMRTCFQHGMGAKQFLNALLVQHLQNYDLLQLSYLQTLAPGAGSLFSTGPFARKFKSFLPFDDKSPDGLQGFVPSASWLRDVYDSLIEEHRDDLNQHMGMLTGRICAIDHSFKLAKHVAKVDGVQIFIALPTVTNEKGEIRICNLVATKSHSQFALALERMRESLNLYGHDQPELFYTDNMMDKEFLERVFPSLQQNVVPIEKYSHLEELTIPNDITISIKQSATTINDAMRTILEALPDDNSGCSLVIGLDTEWNVEVSQHGYVMEQGQTAVLQIAHESNIFILQISPMLAGNQLPAVLKQVLANPRIIKVGRCIMADLKHLQEICHSEVPFVGGLDIGKLAKDRLLVSTARASLADLCATVLNRRLNKNTAIHTSTAWEDLNLTPQQICYAALDVYASLSIYNALIIQSVPKPFSERPEIGTPILLFGNDNTRVLAHGIISSHQNDLSYMGINITPSRAVIEVHEVLIPGALVANGVSPRRSLKSHGDVPFHIVCLQSHLRSPSTPKSIHGCNLNFQSSSAQIQSNDIPPSARDPITVEDEPFMEQLDNVGSICIGDLMTNMCQTSKSPSCQNINSYIPDPNSQAEGKQILGKIPPVTEEWSKKIRSRVLKDPFHVFNMFYIAAGHGLLQEFALTLRDAIFIWDKDDKARLITWGQTQDPRLSWNDLLFSRPKWLLRRCKRIIPPAEQLFPVVKKVFETFGPLKDAKSGLPLFNSAAWTVAKNILLLIQKGHLSDPPDIPLYYPVAIDQKTGLQLYRCMRGTNMTEGGVHTHLRSRLPCSGVSVGTFNSTGAHYIGHYSIWITNELQEMLALVQHMLIDPPQMTGWVNGNLYQPTNEVAGVLPIPIDVQLQSAMGRYIPTLHSKQSHHFLASMQGTQKPVLPVHNHAERALFHELMTKDTGFNDTVTGPNWKLAVQLWNNAAETRDNISYKLTEQLKVYYNGDWKRNTNIKQTKAMTANTRLPLENILCDPWRSSAAPCVPETTRTHHSVMKGLKIGAEIDIPAPPSLSHGSLLLASSPSTFSVQPESSHASAPHENPLISIMAGPSVEQTELAAELARKRARESLPDKPSKKPRKRRTCR